MTDVDPMGVLLEGLPDQVVNELAILEDRALRAEQRANQLDDRLTELRTENGTLRNALDELRGLAYQLKTRAEENAAEATGAVEAIEDSLRHVLVVLAQ